MSLLDKIKSALGMEGTESESTGGNTQSSDESGVTLEREMDDTTDSETETIINTDTDDTQSDVDEKATENDDEEEAEAVVDGEEEEAEEAEEAEAVVDGEEEEVDPQSPEASGTMVDTDAGVETGEIAGQANTQTGPADEPGEATGPTSTDSPGPATGQGDEVTKTETDEVDAGSESPGEDVSDTEREAVDDDDGEEVADEDSEPATDETDETEEPDSDGEPVDVIKGVGSAYAETLGEGGIESVDDLANADPETLAEETGISPKRIERWIGRAQHR